MAGQQSFSATVEAWVAETKARAEAVFHEAAQEVVAEMQKPVKAGGNMPVDLGHLRASLQAGIGVPVNTTSRERPAGAQPVDYDPGPVNLVIAGAELGEEVFATYGMAYALFQEYGTVHQPGRGFVALAAQRWPQIVTSVAARMRSQK